VNFKPQSSSFLSGRGRGERSVSSGVIYLVFVLSWEKSNPRYVFMLGADPSMTIVCVVPP
jgi:hypothetical protein